MTGQDAPLVAWYGDDFTGSAASMEVLEFAGLPAVLFLDIPTAAQRARFPLARAIGIASTARAQTPDWMRAHLPEPIAFLQQTGAKVVHYKVCSTLDSAPEIGSIGTAIEVGSALISGPVLCLVAAPDLRRYQAFGQLFAAAGERVFRLDRHPVMSCHPVTPMAEADVARHLSAQTDKRIGLITVEDLAKDPAAALAREVESGAEVISLDAMQHSDMAAIGHLIWDGPQRFVIGSQGVEYALVAHWRATGTLPIIQRRAGAGPVAQMLAVSGSVSPITAAQIDWAKAHGFEVIALDTAAVAQGNRHAEETAFSAAMAAVKVGRDPLICSAQGPNDPAVAALKAADVPPQIANGRIGAALGRLLKRLLLETGLRRAVISGGDTSGYVCKELGLFAFTALAPTVPGGALFEAHTDDMALRGLQLALKGGQMGSIDYFGWIKCGGGTAEEE
jgi:3-oxoisoapionate kinase